MGRTAQCITSCNYDLLTCRHSSLRSGGLNSLDVWGPLGCFVSREGRRHADKEKGGGCCGEVKRRKEAVGKE